MALSISEANAVSHKCFDKGMITDQVYEENEFLNRMKRGGRLVVKPLGNSIQHTIKYKELGDATSIDPDAARVTSRVETRTALDLDPKYSKVDIIITWKERNQNYGEPQIIDLLRSKMKEGLQDINKEISTQLWQANSSRSSYDMNGFYNCVQTTASDSTYGGISSGDASSWIAGLYDTTTTTLALFGTGSLEAGWRACWFIEKPDLMVTTKALNGIYASKLQPGERRNPGQSGAGAMDNYFLGIPILVDPQANDDDWLFVNTKQMWFYVQSGENFDQGEWEDDPDRYKAMRKLITVVGNFVFTRRKNFGAYTAITS